MAQPAGSRLMITRRFHVAHNAHISNVSLDFAKQDIKDHPVGSNTLISISSVWSTIAPVVVDRCDQRAMQRCRINRTLYIETQTDSEDHACSASWVSADNRVSRYAVHEAGSRYQMVNLTIITQSVTG